MIVRLNLDMAGIKLKLNEWSVFSPTERLSLATRPCTSTTEVAAYTTYLAALVRKKTGHDAAMIEVDQKPLWRNIDEVPGLLQEKAAEFGWDISVDQWRRLTQLQRFALLKLCRPSHENKNFPKAMKEIGLDHQTVI